MYLLYSMSGSVSDQRDKRNEGNAAGAEDAGSSTSGKTSVTAGAGGPGSDIAGEDEDGSGTGKLNWFEKNCLLCTLRPICAES